MPKVLYIAGGFIGSTTLDRKLGLINAGWKIQHLSSDPWMRDPHRLWRSIHHRVHQGPLIWRFNAEILRVSTRMKPDIVWIDKGIWVTARTLEMLKRAGARLVHYTPDPAIAFHATPNFLASLPLYDLAITSKAWELDEYKMSGAKRVFFCHQGASPHRVRPLQPLDSESEYFSSDVVFVGHAEPHYVQTMLEISRLLPAINLKIWGAWGKAVRAYPQLKRFWQGSGVYGDDYAKSLTSARIGMGLLTKYIPETETTRSFEIPACGTLLLAERTTSHMAFYKEGEEAEFYSSPEEAVRKIAFYLENGDRRGSVARAGHRRFIESDYTSDRFMRDCVREVEAILSAT